MYYDEYNNSTIYEKDTCARIDEWGWHRYLTVIRCNQRCLIEGSWCRKEVLAIKILFN